MVILKLADKFGLERKPFGIAVVARPAAGASGSFSGETAIFGHEWFQDFFQLLSLVAGKTGAEPDVIKPATFVVQAKQQRADFFPGLLPAACGGLPRRRMRLCC